MEGVNSKINMKSIMKLFRGQGALVSLILLCIVATIRYENFLSVYNISNILRQGSMIGLVATGMTFVILTGGIDLSVGSVVAVSAVLAANLSGNSIVIAIVVPLLVGGFLGLVNGLVISKLKIPPFITTLAMMMGVRGIAYISTGEVSVRVNKLATAFTEIGRGEIFGFPIPSLIFIVVVIIVSIILKFTPFGRHVLAVGGNEEAARVMGLRVDRTITMVYVISGLLSALAGVILASRLGAGQPVAADGWEMTAIAAVVLGGTQLTGGVGKFSGTFIGVLIIGIITNMFNMQGDINTWWQNVLMGGVLLMVIIIQSQVTKKRITKPT